MEVAGRVGDGLAAGLGCHRASPFVRRTRMLCRARMDRVVVRTRRRKGAASDDAVITLLRAVRTGRSWGPTPIAGHSPIGSFLRACYLAPVTQKPRAQLHPHTAKLGRRHDGHAPTDDGADAQHPATLPRLGGMVDGGVVVLVSWLVSRCAHCRPCRRSWVMWVCSCRCTWASWLWVSGMATSLPPDLALPARTHPGCRSGIPAVDRQGDSQTLRQPRSTADDTGRL